MVGYCYNKHECWSGTSVTDSTDGGICYNKHECWSGTSVTDSSGGGILP